MKTAMQLPEVRQQPYHRKLYAQHLVNRGADAALVLFWLNLITGAYSHIGPVIVASQVLEYCGRYPQFEPEIIEWFKTFDSLETKPKPSI